MTGDTTKPALFERLSQQSDLTVCVDDVVVRDESRAYAQLGRALFDRTTRAVSGKVRQPFSSAMFTVIFCIRLRALVRRKRFPHFQEVLLQTLAYGFDTPRLMFLPLLQAIPKRNFSPGFWLLQEELD